MSVSFLCEAGQQGFGPPNPYEIDDLQDWVPDPAEPLANGLDWIALLT